MWVSGKMPHRWPFIHDIVDRRSDDSTNIHRLKKKSNRIRWMNAASELEYRESFAKINNSISLFMQFDFIFFFAFHSAKPKSTHFKHRVVLGVTWVYVDSTVSQCVSLPNRWCARHIHCAPINFIHVKREKKIYFLQNSFSVLNCAYEWYTSSSLSRYSEASQAVEERKAAEKKIRK